MRTVWAVVVSQHSVRMKRSKLCSAIRSFIYTVLLDSDLMFKSANFRASVGTELGQEGTEVSAAVDWLAGATSPLDGSNTDAGSWSSVRAHVSILELFGLGTPVTYSDSNGKQQA